MKNITSQVFQLSMTAMLLNLIMLISHIIQTICVLVKGANKKGKYELHSELIAIFRKIRISKIGEYIQ